MLQWGGGKVSDFTRKKRYEDVRFNGISVTRGWVGVKYPEKTLEWPHTLLRRYYSLLLPGPINLLEPNLFCLLTLRDLCCSTTVILVLFTHYQHLVQVRHYK